MKNLASKFGRPYRSRTCDTLIKSQGNFYGILEDQFIAKF